MKFLAMTFSGVTIYKVFLRNDTDYDMIAVSPVPERNIKKVRCCSMCCL